MKESQNLHNLKAQIIFAQDSQEEETFHQRDLVQLYPYGLSVTTDVARPFLLLKDEAHQYTLPVAISPIEAGVTMAQSNKTIPESSPHKFTAMLLQSMGVEIKQAVFVEIKGSFQYLRLYLSGNPSLSSLKLRSDEVMSLCLYLGVPIFATAKFIGRSRVMTASLENGSQKLQALGLVDRGNSYLN